MNDNVFTSKQAKEIITYVRERYGDELEFLWEKSPRNAIWRNQQNRKWYAILMTITRDKLGLASDETIEVIDLRFARGEASEFAESNANVYPGYHMNKKNWITIILDGSMATEQILALLEQSYGVAGE